MHITEHGLLILLLVFGGLALSPPAAAGEERSEGVASATVPFEAGKSVPDLEHRFIKIRSLNLEIGEPSEKKRKQKISMKMRVENFGEHDHQVIITADLLDAEDKVVARKTVKDDIDDNDSEGFKLKFVLPESEVARIENVRLEVSHLRD